MTNAGELMYAAPAPVLVPAQATRLQTFHVVIVAAPGLGAEQTHDRLPFASVGFDSAPEYSEGYEVSGFVRHRAVEEILRVAGEECQVVAYQAAQLVGHSYLTCGSATEVETDARRRHVDPEVSGGKLDQLQGALHGHPL